MSPIIFILVAIGLGVAAWLAGRARAWSFRKADPHSRPAARPIYHAWYVAIWAIVPVVTFILLWTQISPHLITQSVLASVAGETLPASGFEREVWLAEARAVAVGASANVFNAEANDLVEPYRQAIGFYNPIGFSIAILVGFVGGMVGFLKVRPDLRARTRVERAVMAALLVASLVAILTTVGIFVSLIFETLRFFALVSPIDFLFGTFWGPDTSIDPATPDGAQYGAVPLFWGTVFIGAIIAMIVAIPLGLMSAIYLTQYANPKVRSWAKPALEVLAGVPTVVYGYFAALTIAPALRDAAVAIGMSDASTESALAAGVVMGVMIIPFVSSMADDSIAAVPASMRDGSLAMGATPSETIKKVLFPAALPGIVAGIMLAISRAIGETMIVVMAASTAANLSANPLDRMTTVTVQIVRMLTGESAIDHPATLSAYALGFVLFVITLALNVVALRVVKQFREAYE